MQPAAPSELLSSSRIGLRRRRRRTRSRSGYASRLIASRPPRKCSIVGDGIVTFGVCVVTDLQELEIGALDRLRHGAPCRVTCITGGAKSTLPVGAVEADGDAALGLDAVELRQKVDVEIGAPELAVGDAVQAEVLLEF